MKTTRIPSLIAAALAAVLAHTTVRAADLTPAETKAIAEEAFIYGLPIVMNYAVMYEYSVDKNSGQYKAPFNQINNEARVFTYKDTAIVTPNSDTPYSLLWLDLRAEPMVLSVPAVEKPRYYSVMLCDGNTYNYGYIGSRATGIEAGDYLVAGPDWKGETPAGHQEGVPVHARSSRSRPTAPSSSTRRTCPTWSRFRRATRCSRSPLISSSPRRPPAPTVDFPKINNALVKTGFLEYLDFALQFAPAGPEEKEIRAKLARLGIGAGKTFDPKALSPEQKAAIGEGMKDGEAKIEEYLAAGTEGHQRLESRVALWRRAPSTMATG